MNDNMAPSEDLESACPSLFAMNDYCRLCANKGDNMVPIYADEGADHRLETKIKIHLPFLNICIDDVLPKRICYNCASALLVWDELFDYSSVADEKLRSWFQSTSYDQGECKTVSFEDIGEFSSITEYEDISEVNIFNKNEKSDKTLNEMGKVSSISKSVNVLSHGLKPSVIQEDKKLNSNLKSDTVDTDDMFNGLVDDNDDSVSNMYLNAAGIDDEDMNRLMDCHRLDMSASVDCSILKEEYLDAAEDSLVKTTDLCDDDDDDDDDFDYRHADDMSNVAIMSAGEDFVDDEETDADGFRSLEALKTEDEDEDYDEDDEGFPVSMIVRNMYLNAENEADGNGELQETVCEICATVFKTRYNLLRHFQKRHPEFKMFECDLCRISFPGINEFKEHLEKEHSKIHTAQSVDSKEVRFACDVCGNMYKNKASAMNHLLTHTAKKTVHCTQCDFSCYTKQQLSVHQTKHDKRFFCDICHKRFAQKSQLDVHVSAVHYNQRPYSCVLCKKTFKTKGSHDAHMVVHTDTRNYQCPHCDKKCRKRYDLTLHIRTHTGEKPFKCSVCGRGFVQMCDTRKHEMLHFKRGKKKSVYYSQMSDAMDDE